MIENFLERDIKAAMRVALGQEPHQGSQMGDAINRVRDRKITRRTQAQALNCIIAEMLVQARSPGRAHAVAWLQDRFEPRTKSAAHETQMAPMVTRHQLEDAIRLPVPLDPQYDAFIRPLHVGTVSKSLFRKFQTHGAIALRIFSPAFTHLHKQEEMHLGLNDPGNLLAGRFADGLDGLPSFAEHDLALAFALDINGLLDADVTGAQFLPDLGLD